MKINIKQKKITSLNKLLSMTKDSAKYVEHIRIIPYDHNDQDFCEYFGWDLSQHDFPDSYYYMLLQFNLKTVKSFKKNVEKILKKTMLCEKLLTFYFHSVPIVNREFLKIVSRFKYFVGLTNLVWFTEHDKIYSKFNDVLTIIHDAEDTKNINEAFLPGEYEKGAYDVYLVNRKKFKKWNLYEKQRYEASLSYIAQPEGVYWHKGLKLEDYENVSEETDFLGIKCDNTTNCFNYQYCYKCLVTYGLYATKYKYLNIRCDLLFQKTINFMKPDVKKVMFNDNLRTKYNFNFGLNKISIFHNEQTKYTKIPYGTVFKKI